MQLRWTANTEIMLYTPRLMKFKEKLLMFQYLTAVGFGSLVIETFLFLLINLLLFLFFLLLYDIVYSCEHYNKTNQ